MRSALDDGGAASGEAWKRAVGSKFKCIPRSRNLGFRTFPIAKVTVSREGERKGRICPFHIIYHLTGRF